MWTAFRSFLVWVIGLIGRGLARWLEALVLAPVRKRGPAPEIADTGVDSAGARGGQH